jgi:hypothetical protein
MERFLKIIGWVPFFKNNLSLAMAVTLKKMVPGSYEHLEKPQFLHI